MSLTSTYVQVYGQIPDFFSKLQQGQAPAKFTQQHLKDIGFTSVNHRAFIPLLKALGFLTADGVPTPRYHDYRNRAEAPGIMAEALREAYGDLFVIKDPPTEQDKALFEGKFKSTHNVGDRIAELMTRTFLALLKIADLKATGKVPKTRAHSEHADDGEKSEAAVFHPGQKQIGSAPSLHYNIQIHLPATKDLEVYNAIFKSLKEHLLG
jgi:Family of unknown function (DUF5343)